MPYFLILSTEIYLQTKSWATYLCSDGIEHTGNLVIKADSPEEALSRCFDEYAEVLGICVQQIKIGGEFSRYLLSLGITAEF